MENMSIIAIIWRVAGSLNLH